MTPLDMHTATPFHFTLTAALVNPATMVA